MNSWKYKVRGRLINLVMLSALLLTISSCTENRLPEIVKAPGFILTNQDNEEIQMDQFKDKVVLLSFIYTRCPMPQMCSLTMKNFKQLQDALEKDQIEKVSFIIITFDPETDTPEKLREYGKTYGADFGNWDLLTGSKSVIDIVCENYAIFHESLDNGLIRHSMKALLLDKKNHIRKAYVENDWSPQAVIKDIQTLLYYD